MSTTAPPDVPALLAGRRRILVTGSEALPQAAERHQLLQVDLTDAEATAAAVKAPDPDLVLHLAAESHVNRSIEGPEAFIDSNVSGAFQLLQAVWAHWEQLPGARCQLRRRSSATTRAVGC